MKELKELRLSRNLIEGSIPSEMSNMNKLEVLRLDDNSLFGSIPVKFGNLSRLKFFSASYNDLMGSIPEAVMNLSNLEVFYIPFNDFSGTISKTYEVEVTADCGLSPKATDPKVTCENCAVCCNDDKECIELDRTLPKPSSPFVKEGKNLFFEMVVLLLIAGGCCCIGFIFVGVTQLPWFRNLNDGNILSNFQKESVNRFLLSRNFVAYLIAIFSNII